MGSISFLRVKGGRTLFIMSTKLLTLLSGHFLPRFGQYLDTNGHFVRPVRLCCPRGRTDKGGYIIYTPVRPRVRPKRKKGDGLLFD